MIVLCEGCERRFQLDDSRIPATGARVRCKYCQHRFRVPPPGGPSNEASSPSASSPEARGNSTSPTEISAEDTLFGTPEGQGVGAPIDGDRSLFGTIEEAPGGPLVDEFAPAEPAEPGDAPADELNFVSDPPLEWADEAAESSDEAAEPSEKASSDSAAAEASPAEAAPAEAAETSGEPDSDPAVDPSASGDDAAGEGSWEFVESNLSFDEELHEPTEAELTGEPSPAADAPLAAADEAEETVDPADTLESMTVDLGASHPGGGASTVDPTPSMRAVVPGPGADAVMFEMVEGEDESEPLELAVEDGSDSEGAVEAAAPETDPSAEPAGPEESTAVSAAPEEEPAEDTGEYDDAPALAEATPSDAPSETSVAEIGTVDDWDRLASEDDAPVPVPPAPESVADEPADSEVQDFAPEPEPDVSGLPDDFPEVLPPAARRGNTWLEHAGWALSLLLLLAVAQGTIHIEPAAIESPPGLVEIEGLQAENVRGRFVENAHSGTLFVVSGELRNRSTQARAGGPLRVVVLDEHGFAFEGRGATVGMTLAEASVRETPIGALQQKQAVLARTLGETALAPGEGVNFQAILGELPDGAVRFRLEPADLPAKKADAELPGAPPEAAREPDAPEVG